MVPSMKECGEMENAVAKDVLLMLMEIFIKESGLMIWQMARGYSWTPLVLSIQGHGSMTYSMELERKAGIMQRQDMSAYSTKERKMEKEDLNGKMGVSMKGIS
jgi:hypothetical protein